MALELRRRQGLVGKSVLLTIPFINHCLDDHGEHASIKVKI